MRGFAKYLSQVQQGLVQIMFPNVCVCCGEEALPEKNHICAFCLEERFENALFINEVNPSKIILPDCVDGQYALWMFDKGGTLQELMHKLKYERLTAIGCQLGQKMARQFQSVRSLKQNLLETDSMLLVPVPLHYLKFRKRGFNQAFYIAKGISEVLSIPICSINAVRRKKYTQSQTGFTLQKRIKNMHQAFSVSDQSQIASKDIIIVDDVFTTGATSFELARTLSDAGAASIMIWTIAQA